MIGEKIILVGDGHFHVYPCYQPARAVSALIANLSRLAASARGLEPGRDVFKIAFLVEGGAYDYFQKILRKEIDFSAAGLEVCAGQEEPCLSFVRDGKTLLVLVAGRQIATAERLEILGLGVSEKITDGLSAEEIIGKILAAGGLPVLPFSPGKWLFKRAEIVRHLAEKYGRDLIVGDSALRPLGWGEPEIMRRAGGKVLPGSDPLPLAGEEKYAGRYGFVCQGPFDSSKPLTAIKEIIANKPEAIVTAGSRRSLANVMINLYRLQRKNKTSSASSTPRR